MIITLIGNTTSYGAERLKEEAELQGVTLQLVTIQSLILSVANNDFVLSCKEYGDISHNDCYLFRGIGSADQEMMIIAKCLAARGATIIEEKTATGALLMDKLFILATEKLVPTPNFQLVQSEQTVAEIAPTLSYPIVMKSTIGSMGKNVALVRDESELDETFAKLGPRVIIQDYYPVDHDVRALVIAGKCIGAYSRRRSDGDFRMNRPDNSKAVITLPDEAIEMCEQAAVSQNIEIAGVDIIEYKGDWYVLEVNTAPQFSKFEEYTQVNVAKHIIDYAITKVNQSRANQ